MTPRPRVAAIDCGTNTIRLLVADVQPGPHGPSLVDVHREERIIRLGEGVDATGLLTSGALDRAWHALSDYVAVIRATGADPIRMAATSATRDARNRDRFVDMVTATLGQPPEVISGEDEAELTYLGAVADLVGSEGDAAQRFLVVDIGGGSTELVVGDGDDPHSMVSLDVGSVRLTERILRSNPPTPDEVARADAWVRPVVGRALDALGVTAGDARTRQTVAVAVSGTAVTIAEAVQYRRGQDPRLAPLPTVTAADVSAVTAQLLRATTAHRASLPWLHPGRVDVIGAGALIFRNVAEILAQRGIPSVTVSEHDILDGLAMSLVPPELVDPTDQA